MSKVAARLLSEEWWAANPQVVRCHAKNRLGEPCRRQATAGAVVCHRHGAHLPNVKKRAAERIAAAADDAASRLIRWMADDSVPIAERRKIAESLLDRAGLNAKQTHDVIVRPEWEGILETVVITRDPKQVTAEEVLDAEVIAEWNATADRDPDPEPRR